MEVASVRSLNYASFMSELTKFYERYTQLVPETDLLPVLRDQWRDATELLRSIPEAESRRPHGPYTWTLRQVAGHLSDAERVFGYRALRFSRGDEAPLPGFDEHQYVDAGRYDEWPLADLADHFSALRQANLVLATHFPADAWTRSGVASDVRWTVDDLVRSLVGHVRHHEAIIRRRLGWIEEG
jgi:DinB superfamily